MKMAEEIKKEKAEAAKKKTAEKKPADDKRLKVELEDTKKKLEAKEIELSEQNDKYMRMIAEYDNFRKRTAKEKTDIYANATAKAVEGLLPVIDNFERALLNDKDNQGFNMMYSQFCEYLQALGVKAMETEGAKFDPNMHIAVMHVEDEGYGENEIVQVLQKGYTLGDKVIRPACVKVAN